MSDITRPEQTPPQTDTPLNGVPHSGELGYELPVHDFDNTTLQEAVDKELIAVPEDVTALTDAAPATQPLPEAYTYTDSPRRSRRLLMIGGGVAAIAGAIGLAIGMGGSSSNDKQSDDLTVPSDDPGWMTDDEMMAEYRAEQERAGTATTVAPAENIDPVETEESPASVPEASGDVVGRYQYISAQEGDLLHALKDYNYPDRIRGGYDAAVGKEEDTFFAVGRDMAATINTRDYAAFDSYFVTPGTVKGGQFQETADEFDAFYAPDSEFIRQVSCTDNGGTRSCTGYLMMYPFHRDKDVNDRDTQERINNPTYEGQPTTAGEVYLELRYTINKSDNRLSDFYYYIHFDEPDL